MGFFFYPTQDSKARELSSWESDLKRREAVGFTLLFRHVK
jgi:hypothetical protein